MVNQSDASALRRLDLNLLPLFAALMRERSVTRAGRTLFLSQSATSAALARLRVGLSDELFIRSGNVLEPTPRAEQLFASLSPLLEEISSVLSEAAPFDPLADERTFQLGVGQDMVMLAQSLPSRFRQEAPHSRLVIQSSNFRNVADLLETGKIGSAIGFSGAELSAATKRKVLWRGGFRVLRDGLTPGPVDLDTFCERPHILVTPRGDLVGFVDDILKRLNRSRRVVLGVPGFAFLKNVIIGTEMLCTVSDILADAIIHFGDGMALAADPAPFATPESTVHLVWRASLDHDPAEIWFRSFVQRVIQDNRARLSLVRSRSENSETAEIV